MRFVNKIVLVLGGTGSIGSAVAGEFEREGATVLRHGTRNTEYSADLTDGESARQLFDKVFTKVDGIDILVHSISAPVTPKRFSQKSWEDFSAHIDVQVRAAFETVRYVVPAMKERGGGNIVYVLTTYVDGETPGSLLDYLTAKYALWGFTKGLAKELARHRINVNGVSPGTIDNSLTEVLPKKLKEMIAAETPLGRLATPKDVAHTVLFLASPEASFITGENVHVDGGAHL